MASKSRRTPNFSEEEKLLVAEFGREFPEVEVKATIIKRWERKQMLGKKFWKTKSNTQLWKNNI